MANYDILGNIAIIKFPDETGKEEKLKKAKELASQYKSVRTVLEKSGKVHGRLRTIKTKYLLGEKNLIAEYIESGCKFRFNVETCYFSPRLANERMEIAQLIKKSGANNVLVMFAGVGPFSVIIAKYACPKRIVSIELGKECCKYAAENARKNKVVEIETIQGDVKRAVKKLHEKFDFIVMPRPNLKETFLKEALGVAKKGARIVYYGFCAENKLVKMMDDLHKEAGKFKKKIKITNVKEAGDIAPYEHRYRIEIKVL